MRGSTFSSQELALASIQLTLADVFGYFFSPKPLIDAFRQKMLAVLTTHSVSEIHLIVYFFYSLCFFITLLFK